MAVSHRILGRRFVGATALLLLLAGCGPLPGQSGGGGSGGNGGGSGGQTPTTYTDARHHYRLTAPGPMKAKSDGTSSYASEREYLDIAVVEGAGAADPAALARKDASSLGSSKPDFRLLSPPAPTTLGGKQVVKFTYASTTGDQGGAKVQLTNARYYIPKDQSQLAVVSYGDDAAEYDATEADGIISSFQWL
jgi:hypothetical protein